MATAGSALRSAVVVGMVCATVGTAADRATARPEPPPPAFGTVFVANGANGSITVYAPGATGNATPIDTITGTATDVSGIAVDPLGGIYVADQPLSEPGITEYAPGASGDATPTVTLAGDSTFTHIFGITLAPNGNLWVAGKSASGPELVEYDVDAATGDAPIAVISGALTDLNDNPGDGVMDVAVTPDGADVWATTVTSLLEFSTSANGNVAPVASFSGTNTELKGPGFFENDSHIGLTVDGSGDLWTSTVANDGQDSNSPTDPHPAQLLEFSTNSSEGNVAPIADVSGTNTGFSPGAAGDDPDEMDVAIDAAGNLWASDGAGANGQGGADAEIAEFPGNANGDVTPDPVIEGSNTGLDFPVAIAVAGTAPSAPTSPAATGGSSEVSVSWSAPAQTGGALLGYRVLRASSSGGPYTVVDTTNSGTSYDDTDVTNGSTYYYKVEAYNGVGLADTTPMAATPATVPGAPTGLKAKAHDASVGLTWSAPASSGGSAVTGYTVLRKSGSSSLTAVGTSTTTSFADSKLHNGTTYIYEVEARNAVGLSAASDPVAIAPVGPPAAPRKVSAKAAKKSITVKWSAPASTGGAPITGYVVEYATCKVGSPACKAKSLSVGSSTSRTVKKLKPGTKYYLAVAAKNAAGLSKLSSVVSAKPKA